MAATALLAQEGVDLTGLQVIDAPTGVALIQLDAAGENTIAVLPGANARLTSVEVRAGLAGLQYSDVVLLQQEIPQDATRSAIAAAQAAGTAIVLNVPPVSADSADLAALADIVIVNESDFEIIASAPPSVVAAEAWCRATGRKLALTLGAAGAILASDGQTLQVLPPRIMPLGTVGAGDTFAGYLAAGLHARKPLRDALQIAVTASSLTCLSAGAQFSMPVMAEIVSHQALRRAGQGSSGSAIASASTEMVTTSLRAWDS